MTDPSPPRDTLPDDSDRADAPAAGFELVRGASVGRYIVIEKIGAGGMGVVYSAFDPDLDRRIALKLLHPSRDGSATGLARLLREAQAMAQVSHPNVVTVHDVGEHTGGIFLAMELVTGSTLSDWLTAGARSWEEILAVLRQSADGLLAVHDRGLVHRDVKPDNVMVADDGRVRLMDFGLVRAQSDRDDRNDRSAELRGTTVLRRSLTHGGAVLGTPLYMAPEQMAGGEVGPAADQFSWCATAYEALCGVRAFTGGSLPELEEAIARGDIRPPPPTATVPAWIRGVLVRGLAADPARRWPSVRDLLDALAADPRPRRARWIAAATVAGIGVAGVAAFRLHAEQRRSACSDAAAEIERHWSPSIAAQVRAAFDGSGVVDPGDAFARVTPWLDRWAESWSGTASEVCIAATIEDRLPPDLYGNAQDCLTERAAELDELVRQLLSPSAHAVREAIASASALSPVGSCSDVEQLRRVPIVGEAHRADATAIRERLARAATIRTIGDSDAGLTEAEAALEAAAVLDLQPLVARAHLEVGAAHVRRDEPKRAEVALRTAYRLATAAGIDDVAADAARRLVYVSGYQLERGDAAELWYEVAEAALDRMRLPPDDARRATLLAERASVRAVTGKVVEARDDLGRALTNYIARLGEQHPEVVALLVASSVVNLQLDDAATAEQQSTRALAIATQIWGDDHVEQARVLTHHASVLEALGRLDEAIAAARTGLAIHERARESNAHVAAALNSLALKLGTSDEALALLQRALEITEAVRGPGHREVAYCHNNIGHIAFGRGDYARSAAEHERAAAILSATERPDALALAQTIYNAGTARARLGEQKPAIAAFDRALPLAVSVLGESHPFVGLVHSAAGRSRAKAGDPAGAIVALEKSLAIAEKSGGSPVDVANDRMYLERSRWQLGGDLDAARRAIEAALATFEQHEASKHAELARTWLAELPR